MRDQGLSILASARRALLRPFAWVAGFSLALNLLVLVLPLYMMQVFDRVLSTQSLDTLIYLTAIALFALLALAAFDLVRARLLLGMAEWLEARLAPHLFDRLIASALAGSGPRAEGSRDLATLRQFLAAGTVSVVLDAPWVPFFIAATWLIHPLLGAIALGAALLLFSLAVAGELVTRAPLEAASREAGQAAAQAAAAMRSAETIDAMGMGQALLARWYGASMRSLGHGRCAAARASALAAASKFARLAVQVLLMAAGAWLVTEHAITGGGMIAASIIMSRALAPVEQAIGTARQLTSARLAYRRLREALAMEGRPRSGLALPRPSGRLTAEAAAWTPVEGERPVLRGIAFELAPGESMAIIGPSAAGKSSLARLLVGLRKPTEGHVRLDGADVSSWPREDFGCHVGYLPQEVSLLPGTVAENIARMGEIDGKAVIEAARRAGVHDMILRLPQGYDTPIDDASSRLSGGQRQRLALARALYGDPRLVVLDEPNASLDADGDAALAAAILDLKARGATVVVVTHRMALVSQMDKLLLLKDGAVETIGPRKQVMERLRARPQPVAASAPTAAAAARQTA
jgi:PrtD family type I secretion system ABC transporter